MRRMHLVVCLMAMLVPGIAFAASPIAYVYVAEDSQFVSTSWTTSPISAFSVASNGQLTQISGSPFTQTTGFMLGFNGTQLVTGNADHVYSFDVASDGVIGKEASSASIAGIGNYAGYWTNNTALSPSGKFLAMIAGEGVQFFYLDGTATKTITGIVGTSGFVSAIAWDSSSHLYALNGASGKLHVYTVSTTSVVEAPGSPYEDIPFCGSTSGNTNCPQKLIVRGN
jgi:WD40 repeat protein